MNEDYKKIMDFVSENDIELESLGELRFSYKNFRITSEKNSNYQGDYKVDIKNSDNDEMIFINLTGNLDNVIKAIKVFVLGK